MTARTTSPSPPYADPCPDLSVPHIRVPLSHPSAIKPALFLRATNSASRECHVLPHAQSWPHTSWTPTTIIASPIPFTYPSPLPALPHLGITEGDEQQWEQISKDKCANHIGLLVAWVGPVLPAKGLVAGLAVKEALVVSHG